MLVFHNILRINDIFFITMLCENVLLVLSCVNSGCTSQFFNIKLLKFYSIYLHLNTENGVLVLIKSVLRLYDNEISFTLKNVSTW